MEKIFFSRDQVLINWTKHEIHLNTNAIQNLRPIKCYAIYKF